MNAGKEMILLYYPKKPHYLQTLKGTLVQMGIRIRTVSASQINQSVGFLAGLSGYHKRDASSELPVIPEEMLIMKNFSSERMDRLFTAMRRRGIPSIPLKAVVTDTNVQWSFYELYLEIKKEHEMMTSKKGTDTETE